MRKNGYYFVKRTEGHRKFIIAQWDGGSWWVCGYGFRVPDSFYKVVLPDRIPQPTSNKEEKKANNE